MKEAKETLSLRIPKDLKKKFKVACAEDETEMTLVIERLIEQWLHDRGKRSK